MADGSWWSGARRWVREGNSATRPAVRIGLALGGGFARGISHVGVLRVFEKAKIPISCISGVSAGSIVAAAFASGSTSDEIELVARTMRFSDVARWRLGWDGLMGSHPMTQLLQRTLKVFKFEQMQIPLAIVASDLNAGVPAIFRDHGDVVLPIRASCSYPGLFQPVRYKNRCLVDGMISMDVPAHPLRAMGATHVISVSLPTPTESVDPQNMLSVVTRCFQIMNGRTETQWRRHSNAVICPQVHHVGWNSFESAQELIQAGERAAQDSLPQILRWLPEPSEDTSAVA